MALGDTARMINGVNLGIQHTCAMSNYREVSIYLQMASTKGEIIIDVQKVVLSGTR